MSEESSSEKTKRIVAIIGAAALIIAALIGIVPKLIGDTPSPAPTVTTNFTYQVRVQDQDTGEAIAGADVRIEIGGGIAPVDDVTGSNGIVMIPIDSSRTGKSAKLIVIASGYDRYEKSMTLIEGALPNVIQLAPAP